MAEIVPRTPDAPRRKVQRLPTWVRVFCVGAVLWVGAAATTFATGNPNLVPTVILLGSFLVPLTFVLYAFGRADEVITPQRIFTAFICGGVLGVLGAAILEAPLRGQPFTVAFGAVGLIEEAVKLGALWLLARNLPRFTVRDGMVLGAAVGFGFAALESSGYAFTALFTSHGLSLVDLVETEALRAALAPVGHGLWTAILGGALFATAARSPRGRPHLTAALACWYLLIAALHALWDAAAGIAAWLTLLLTGTPTQWVLIRLGRVPSASPGQLHLDTALTWGFQGTVAVVGLLVLLLRRRPVTPRVAVRLHPLGN